MIHDFTGTATAYNVKCADGRTILPGSFDHQDGQKVPLVWRHGHKSMNDVLGHVLLQATETGMAVKAVFNNTGPGQHAKQLVRNGDIRHLSIWANKLKEQAKQVSYGVIREVSLVLGGANPGARIENVVEHTDDPFVDDIYYDDVVVIHSGYEIVLAEEESGDQDTQEDYVSPLDEELAHEASETIGDILKTFSPDEMKLVDFLLSKLAGGSK